MKHNLIWNAINERYKADKANNPGFPDHICGQAAGVAAKAGKLMEHAIEKKYKKDRDIDVMNAILENTAIETIVAAIRFLENIK